jgi:hypothetical protein
VPATASKRSVSDEAAPATKAPAEPARKAPTTKATAKTPAKKATAKATAKKATAKTLASTPAKKATNPVKKATTPAQKAKTPANKATTPAKKATSPAKKAATSMAAGSAPSKKATSRGQPPLPPPANDPNDSPASSPPPADPPPSVLPSNNPGTRTHVPAAAGALASLSEQPVAGTHDGLLKVGTNPGLAPELLVAACVEGFGPQARAWVQRMRDIYPLADGAALARLAAAEHIRYAAGAGVGAASAGLLAPLAEIAALMVVHARLILHVAAAHDVDPVAPERTADVLVLTRVHLDADTARKALTATREALTVARQAPTATPEAPTTTRQAPTTTREGAWRAGVPMVGVIASWIARWSVARILPGAAMVLAARRAAEVTRTVAARADQHYRLTGREPKR